MSLVDTTRAQHRTRGAGAVKDRAGREAAGQTQGPSDTHRRWCLGKVPGPASVLLTGA